MERLLLLPMLFMLIGSTQNQQLPQSVTGDPACALMVTSGGQTTYLAPGGVADPAHPIVISPTGETTWQLGGPSQDDNSFRSSDLVWRIYLFNIPIYAQQLKAGSFFGTTRAVNVLPFNVIGLWRLAIDVQSSTGQCSFDTWMKINGDPRATALWFISLGLIFVGVVGVLYSLPVRYRSVEVNPK